MNRMIVLRASVMSIEPGAGRGLQRPELLRANTSMTKLLFVLALILPIVVSGVMVVTLPSQPLVSPLSSPARKGCRRALRQSQHEQRHAGSKSHHRLSGSMFLSIATTHHPATDLGYLLHKHPGRLHEIEQTFGKAWVFYPDASQTRCETEAALPAHRPRMGGGSRRAG
jgi:hypothetical protein